MLNAHGMPGTLCSVCIRIELFSVDLCAIGCYYFTNKDVSHRLCDLLKVTYVKKSQSGSDNNLMILLSTL